MLRGDLKAQNDRTSLQIIAKSGAFPLTGQRKLMEGTPGIIPYGQNEQGQPLSISGPLSDSVYAIPKPEPSQMTSSLFQMLDAQKASQIGMNSMNDSINQTQQSTNPATSALLQQKTQDIQVEDYIMCYGETAVKPLFRIINWFLQQDADHPSVKERYMLITGKPSIDHERHQIGRWRVRDNFRVNVGLGVDAPDYKNAKAGMLLQVFAAFNQAMSGTTLPNLLPKMYQGFRDQVESLGYDADTMLMSRDEFQQYFQSLMQQHQQQQQAQQQMAQEQQQQQQMLLQLEVQSKQAEIREKIAKAQKAEAEAYKVMAEAQIAQEIGAGGEVKDPETRVVV
jgi:hypothetical protein